MPAAGSASSAIATGEQELADEPADDTDEGEPPCDEDLVFKKMENLPTGRPLKGSSEGPMAEDVEQLPCQGSESNREAHVDFHILLGDARRLFKVV